MSDRFSRALKHWKLMWSNVWFRSLVELILVIVGALIFVWGIQHFESGRGVIQQVRQDMGL